MNSALLGFLFAVGIAVLFLLQKRRLKEVSRESKGVSDVGPTVEASRASPAMVEGSEEAPALPPVLRENDVLVSESFESRDTIGKENPSPKTPDGGIIPSAITHDEALLDAVIGVRVELMRIRKDINDDELVEAVMSLRTELQKIRMDITGLRTETVQIHSDSNVIKTILLCGWLWVWWQLYGSVTFHNAFK